MVQYTSLSRMRSGSDSRLGRSKGLVNPFPTLESDMSDSLQNSVSRDVLNVPEISISEPVGAFFLLIKYINIKR